MPSNENVPALLGGRAVRPDGPPSWPIPDEDIHLALEAAYRDGCWGKYHGPYGARLEAELREYLGLEYVLTCASGTFAVELALRATKVGPGDEVILAAYDYPGNCLCIHALGAQPVLIDVDRDNWNMAPQSLRAAARPKIKAVLVSHLHGGMVPMREVTAVARELGWVVIEDAAQCPGARVQGKKAGTWGDIAIWSFGGSKLLCAGRGGALFTNRQDFFQRARLAMHRGNQFCPLSELQAAVIVPQLGKLDERNIRRAANVGFLAERLAGIPGLRLLQNRSECKPAFYKLGFQFNAARFGLERARLVAALCAEGIAIDGGFHAAHVGRSPRRFRKAGDLTEAERAHQGMLVLHHPILLGGQADLDEVAAAFRKIHAHREELQAAGNSIS